MAERVGDEAHTSMPRDNHKQQYPDPWQRSATEIGYIEQLVICNLTGHARIMLRGRGVLVQEADAVDPDHAQQRDLDNPDTPLALQLTRGAMHALPDA